MPSPFETVSVVIAVNFVILSAIVLALVPLRAAAPILPLLAVFLYALYRYLR